MPLFVNGAGSKLTIRVPHRTRAETSMRYDVYVNPIEELRDLFPCVVEIQSDRLYAFSERVCLPLARPDVFPGMTDRLNPAVSVVGHETSLRLHPLGIAVFHQRELRTRLDNLGRDAFTIDSAVDFLLRGY